MTEPLVSVILPTFNRARMLQEAVASVRAQTWIRWELIVVDDGSTDGTPGWLAALQEPRARLIRLTHRGNPAQVRNAGLAVATGELVAFLDDDDLWAPDKLAEQLAGLRSSGCRWSYTAFHRIDEAGADVGPGQRPWRKFAGSILEPLLRIDAVVALPTVMVERSTLRDVGGFDDSMAHCQDYDLWFRLAARHPVHVDERPLASVRVHARHQQADREAVHRQWVRVYAKAARAPGNERLAGLCWSRRAHHRVHVAGILAARGDRAGGLGQLARAVRAAPTLAWWRVLAKLLLPAAVHGWLRSLKPRES